MLFLPPHVLTRLSFLSFFNYYYNAIHTQYIFSMDISSLRELQKFHCQINISLEMTSKSLNAGASTFTPGAPNNDNNKSVPSTATGTIEAGTQLRDSFTEMVEDIDNVMDQDTHGSTTPSDVAPPHTSGGCCGGVSANNTPAVKTSLPSHMAKHAAEFWFPECRECSCCQGFKYGCKCAASNGGSCTCVADDDTPTAATTTTVTTSRQGKLDNVNFHQQQRVYSSSGRHIGGGGGVRRKFPCKFYFTSQGCRYGDSCSFDHTSEG